MGNKVCCQETRTEGVLEKHGIQVGKYPVIADSKSDGKIEIPELLPKVRQTLLVKKFFQEQESRQSNPQVKKYGNDVYAGSLDSNGLKPNGFGRMYKVDRSLYIGHFNLGKAQGKGVFIFADGSYYLGDFVNNTAETENGHFYSETLKYTGGFKNNNFNDKGLQIGKDYIFEGWYNNGSRTRGTLKWQNQTHIYSGTFNQENKLHGKGTLKQPQGTYEGDFWAGDKHGKGIYHFKNGSRYEGDYFKGFRHGYGTIYHGTGDVAYVGQFKFGLPDGKGSMISSKTGKMTETTWIQGIDASLLPQQSH